MYDLPVKALVYFPSGILNFSLQSGSSMSEVVESTGIASVGEE